MKPSPMQNITSPMKRSLGLQTTPIHHLDDRIPQRSSQVQHHEALLRRHVSRQGLYLLPQIIIEELREFSCCVAVNRPKGAEDGCAASVEECGNDAERFVAWCDVLAAGVAGDDGEVWSGGEHGDGEDGGDGEVCGGWQRWC